MNELDQIKERLNVVDYIGETMSLKRYGRNFKGLCPFHSEKTPSFVVSPERNIWKCFGCQKSGDVFTFLMEMERLEFPEALKILADRTGVKLQSRPAGSPTSELKEKLLEMQHLAQEYYHYLLTKHRVGERARLYLKQRGITDLLIATFQLGFAPTSWDNLSLFLRKKGYTNDELVKSGLSISGRVGVYDRFRSRIMFPIKNIRSETIAFSGRVFETYPKEAKYINSPETPLYTKGETLYGIHITKEMIRKQNACVVVEGEFDLISSYHSGVTNVVAIKGSALTDAQVHLLKRFTDRLVLALDADVAGDAATRRGIEIADKAGFEIRVVETLVGKDPDEAARENASMWKKAVQEAIVYFDFMISSACKRFAVDDPYGKKRISDEILPVIARIENPIVQAHYIKILSVKLAVSEDKMSEALKKFRQPILHKTTQVQNPVVKSHEQILEEHMLALIVQAENVASALVRVCEHIDPSDLTQIAIKKVCILLIDYESEHEQIIIAEFASTLPQELVSGFDSAYLSDLTHVTRENWEKELEKTVLHIKESNLRRIMKELTTHMHEAERVEDEAKLTKLNAELKSTSSSLKQLM